MAEGDNNDTKPVVRESISSYMSTFPKNFILCAAFVAGLFIASVTFNVAMYLSVRSKYSTLSSGMAVPPLADMYERGASPRAGQPAVDIYNNIVMIKVRFATYNRCMPWQTVQATLQPGLGLVSSAQASGLILEKGLILTSAYVATDSYLVTITRQGRPQEFQAEVVTVARELDIALLKVKDPSFWKDTDITVKLDPAAEILGRGNPVVVSGFPVGADLSISKLSARVSRVESTAAGYAGRYGAFPQPVLSLYPKIGNDVTVGPVFKESDNTLVGFIGKNDKVVPIRTIAKFMQAYRKDPAGAGFGMLGMIYHPMTGIGMRMYWDMPMNNVGVQIRSVDPASDLFGKVERGDMLVAIDGEPILADGSVSYRKSVDNMGQINNVAMPFSVLLAEKSLGDTAKLSFYRTTEKSKNKYGQHGYNKSKDFMVDVKMKRLNPLAPRTLDQAAMAPPTYFMIGGLVWTVFSEDLVIHSKHLGGTYIPPATHVAALQRWRQNPEEQIVVLLRGLDHPCNKWYSTGAVRILRFFNGEPVLNMEQFVRKVGTALKANDDSLKFTFAALDDEDVAGGPDDPDLVLDRATCEGADKQLMGMHQIGSPVSADLRDVYSQLPEQFTHMPAASHKGATEKPTPRSLPQKKAANKTEPTEKMLVGRPHNKDEDHVQSKDQSRQGLMNLPWTNIVQIQRTESEPNFLNPWKMGASTGSRCSAIIVDKAKRMILTNSHCVANAMSLDVLREDVPIAVKARVIEIAHDVDLAWITTDDDSFWASKDIQPMVSMAQGLPHISHDIRVVGYPQGGNSITITEGIVSRVDGQIYPNGLISSARNTPDNLLIVQVDAAINPGNSGGPVFDNDGQLVGLAFAVMRDVQNVGYVIPNVHLKNFVASVESKSQGYRWKAQSEIGARFRHVQNAGIRAFLKLEKGETGVQVRTIAPGSPLAEKGVVKGDVMVKIDGLSVQGDGRVLREINGRMVNLPFDTIITEKKHGDPTKMEFIHLDRANGNRSHKAFDVVFAPVTPLVPRFYDAPMPVKGREHFAATPTYFIMWGLVWGVFSNPVLKQAIAAKRDVPYSVTKAALHRWRSDPDEEVVVLLQGLGGSSCTLAAADTSMQILEYFNGKKVKNMRDLVNYAMASEVSNEAFMRITFAPPAAVDLAGSAKDPDIVLHRKYCGKVDEEILRTNNIPNQYSPDVAALVLESLKELGVKTAKKAQAEAASMSHSLMQAQSQETAHDAASLDIETASSASDDLQWSRHTVDAMALDGMNSFESAADVDLIGRNAIAGEFAQASLLEESDAIEDEESLPSWMVGGRIGKYQRVLGQSRRHLRLLGSPKLADVTPH